MKSYRDLIVWQKSMNLLMLIYKLGASLADYTTDIKLTFIQQTKCQRFCSTFDFTQSHPRNIQQQTSVRLTI